jgi:hypothetical protein
MAIHYPLTCRLLRMSAVHTCDKPSTKGKQMQPSSDKGFNHRAKWVITWCSSRWWGLEVAVVVFLLETFRVISETVLVVPVVVLLEMVLVASVVNLDRVAVAASDQVVVAVSETLLVAVAVSETLLVALAVSETLLVAVVLSEMLLVLVLLRRRLVPVALEAMVVFLEVPLSECPCCCWIHSFWRILQ